VDGKEDRGQMTEDRSRLTEGRRQRILNLASGPQGPTLRPVSLWPINLRAGSGPGGKAEPFDFRFRNNWSGILINSIAPNTFVLLPYSSGLNPFERILEAS